jgi:hypothetical protein
VIDPSIWVGNNIYVLLNNSIGIAPYNPVVYTVRHIRPELFNFVCAVYQYDSEAPQFVILYFDVYNVVDRKDVGMVRPKVIG